MYTLSGRIQEFAADHWPNAYFLRAERTAEDEVPFDLRTDRYLEYDSDDPAGKLELLKTGLRQTLASEATDSPVFQMLPDLEGHDRSRFLPVPQSFREDVERAYTSRSLGLLGLLAAGSILYLQLPAPRRFHPAVDPAKVMARLRLIGRRGDG